MPENYHVHFFVGISVNGTQYAVPDGVGLAEPTGQDQMICATDPQIGGQPCNSGGVPNQEWYATKCYYHIHTHDPGGMVHVENASPTCGYAANSANPYATPCKISVFTLKNFLDIWGISLTANNFGPFTGAVTVYTGQGQ